MPWTDEDERSSPSSISELTIEQRVDREEYLRNREAAEKALWEKHPELRPDMPRSVQQYHEMLARTEHHTSDKSAEVRAKIIRERDILVRQFLRHEERRRITEEEWNPERRELEQKIRQLETKITVICAGSFLLWVYTVVLLSSTARRVANFIFEMAGMALGMAVIAFLITMPILGTLVYLRKRRDTRLAG